MRIENNLVNRNHKIAYDLPSMKMTRSAGMGFGRREIFGSKSKLTREFIACIDESPSPTNYNLKSEFNSIPATKAYSFGIAREAYSKVYIKEHPNRDPNVPGPG